MKITLRDLRKIIQEEAFPKPVRVAGHELRVQPSGSKGQRADFIDEVARDISRKYYDLAQRHPDLLAAAKSANAQKAGTGPMLQKYGPFLVYNLQDHISPVPFETRIKFHKDLLDDNRDSQSAVDQLMASIDWDKVVVFLTRPENFTPQPIRSSKEHTQSGMKQFFDDNRQALMRLMEDLPKAEEVA